MANDAYPSFKRSAKGRPPSPEIATVSADEALIEAARARTLAANTTLNQPFWRWLACDAQRARQVQRFDALMTELRETVTACRPLTRDEMTQRRVAG